MACLQVYDDFESMCVDLSTLVVRELRLEDDRRLLPRVPVNSIGLKGELLQPPDVYRAHQIELRLCPATDVKK